jgi:putative membrane protein
MIKSLVIAGCLVLAPACFAQVGPSPSDPPPPMPGPTSSATPFMQLAGEGDVYEITSSQIAVKRTSSSTIKQFATMLIEHHTLTTNVMLTQAKAAGLAPPPAVLGQGKRQWIDELMQAAPGDFDRVYLMQQIPAHEEALKLHKAYAASGDTPQLKVAASGAVPIVERHLAEARRLAGASVGGAP